MLIADSLSSLLQFAQPNFQGDEADAYMRPILLRVKWNIGLISILDFCYAEGFSTCHRLLICGIYFLRGYRYWSDILSVRPILHRPQLVAVDGHFEIALHLQELICNRAC